MEDWEIARLVPEDKEFFGVLIRRYEAKIIAYLRRITGASQDSLEDMAQNIFIKTYVNINSYDQKKKFSSWLYAIAHNEAIDFWRKNKKHFSKISLEGNQELFSVLKSQEDLAEAINKKDAFERVEKYFQELSLEYKDALILRYLEEKSYEEMSDIMKKPVSTVGVILKRAKEKLKQIAQKDDELR